MENSIVALLQDHVKLVRKAMLNNLFNLISDLSDKYIL